MNQHDRLAMEKFFAQVDEAGVANAQKAEELHRVIRRVSTTSKDRSYEDASSDEGGRVDGLPIGVVEVDGKLVGFGIHILNEDVYPLQSFEIYLRGCDLVGHLDLSGCADIVFVDVYRNRISSIDVSDMPALRILGLQGNEIAALDPSELPACQGIDIGMNRLTSIDVSCNPELVELYVNDNRLTSLDTSHNAKLKYLRVQNNTLSELDTTGNPLLRHLYATGNPLKSIRAIAPCGDVRVQASCEGADGEEAQNASYDGMQNASDGKAQDAGGCKAQGPEGGKMRDASYDGMLDAGNGEVRNAEDGKVQSAQGTVARAATESSARRPLELVAGEGGTVGLSFNPIYNAQWKETGEWEQSYHAYADDGFVFEGWYDTSGMLVSHEADWQDEYGTSRVLAARFRQQS